MYLNNKIKTKKSGSRNIEGAWGRRKKKSARITHTPAFHLWCHRESNQGHTDFQSVALPTELWHHFRTANIKLKSLLANVL